MNYTTIYNSIINMAIARGNEKFSGANRHHIIPKSLGGGNDQENLVFLNFREHYICHKLLVRITSGMDRKRMACALWRMSNSKKYFSKIKNSRDYSWARAEFIKANINNDPARKAAFLENHKNGKYKYDYGRVSETLTQTLSKLSTTEKLARMKNSALSCDQEKRKQAIRRGKGSKFQLTKSSGEIIEFWSYDDVIAIVGYKYDKIRYRISTHNGVLPNGDVVKYIIRYEGNDAHRK